MSKMKYIIKNLKGEIMAGAYIPIPCIDTAREAAKSMIFAGKVPDIQCLVIYAINGGVETPVEAVI